MSYILQVRLVGNENENKTLVCNISAQSKNNLLCKLWVQTITSPYVAMD